MIVSLSNQNPGEKNVGCMSKDVRVTTKQYTHCSDAVCFALHTAENLQMPHFHKNIMIVPENQLNKSCELDVSVDDSTILIVSDI